jgi:hypothetical protein
MTVLTLNENEVQVLHTLLDAAQRQLGLNATEAVYHFVKMITEAKDKTKDEV